MTLNEIAMEYRKSAELIDGRIRQLRKAIASAEDPARCHGLEMRIKILESMRRDARDLAVLCEHYYDKGYHSNVRYKI